MVPVHAANTPGYWGWRLGDTIYPLGFPFFICISEIVPLILSVTKAYTVPHPAHKRPASPFNFSRARRSYTILGKRVGVEQRKVILTNGHSMQMWASRE